MSDTTVHLHKCAIPECDILVECDDDCVEDDIETIVSCVLHEDDERVYA